MTSNRLLFVLLLMLPSIAVAAPPSQPACWPSQVGGSGTAAVVRVNTVAFGVSWGCSGEFSQSMHTFGGLWSDALPDWQRLLSDYGARGSAGLSEAWSKHVEVWPTDTDGWQIIPAEVYPLVVETYDAAVATLPPAPVWSVAKNASYLDRPAYPFIDGVRSTSSNGRAIVGALCACSIRSVEGRSVYCSVNSRADQVAICRKVE